MDFKIVAVLGIGQLAYQCAKTLKQLGMSVLVYDTNPKKSIVLERQIQGEDITYLHLEKKILFETLANTQEKTLLVSAINSYLIPEKVLDNKNIIAINCHHALLPRHPGRNAEAWAIFEQDDETGITWHFITPDVDAGQILIQKKIQLDDRITSFKLLKYQNNLAYQSFLEIIVAILNNNVTGYPQNMELRGKLHYSWETPNDGYINLDWNGAKISAFLRSMDYGILEILGKPKLVYDSGCVSWKKYQIECSQSEEETLSFVGNSIIINKNDFRIILKDYFRITQT
jgi:methionyl-tRNA formyltransferase